MLGSVYGHRVNLIACTAFVYTLVAIPSHTTIKELNDIIDWTDSFEETDKKHAIKIVNKCSQEINIIKGEK